MVNFSRTVDAPYCSVHRLTFAFSGCRSFNKKCNFLQRISVLHTAHEQKLCHGAFLYQQGQYSSPSLPSPAKGIILVHEELESSTTAFISAKTLRLRLKHRTSAYAAAKAIAKRHRSGSSSPRQTDIVHCSIYNCSLAAYQPPGGQGAPPQAA